LDNGVIHYKTRNDYFSNKNQGISKGVKAQKEGIPESSKEIGKSSKEVEKSSKEVEKLSEADKADKSDKKKDLLKKPLSIGKTLAKAAGKLLSDAKDAVLNNIPAKVSVVPVNILDLGKGMPEPKTEVLDRPAIFFVNGLHLAQLSSDDGGIREMAKYVPDAKRFDWYEEDKILEEIKKRPAYQPIILVGHSLGGDAVVNLANRLNTMKNGFKTVDLLVTMDSVGFNNDIIPANVKTNLNFIGDKDVFFNDGPNIAKDTGKTTVINELRNENHTDIDESRDVQIKIFQKISEVLGDTEKFNLLVDQTYKKFEEIQKKAMTKLGPDKKPNLLIPLG